MEWQFTPLASCLLVAGSLVLLFAPRRYALGALILVAVFVPMSNRVIVSSIDLMTHRLLVLVGLVRLCFRQEARGLSLHTIDKVLIALTLWSIFAYSTLWGTLSGFIYQVGRSFDMIGLYFLFRVFLRSPEDWVAAAKALGVGCVIFAGFMLVESATGKNLLAALGAMSEEVGGRRGRLRCQASFGHAISAGVFGASLVPLWLAAWNQEQLRKWAVLGLVTSTFMTVTSASSSSLLTYVAGLAAFFFWPARHHLRLIRWGVLFLLSGLHLVMQAPVWALLQRINVVGGSTGNYRYRLFDRFVHSFDQWWLLGLKSPEEAFGMWDLCNQFVLEGVRGGLLRLALFVALLALCFREVGRVMANLEDRRQAIWIWALGAMLFAHTAAFWGYDYWDQIRVLLYLLFAVIASASKVCSSGHEGVNLEMDAIEPHLPPDPAYTFQYK